MPQRVRQFTRLPGGALSVGMTGSGVVSAEAQPGTISLTSTSVAVNEGSNATITASRTSGSDGAVAVDWAVSDALTAPASGTLNWAAGVTGTQSASVLAGLVAATTQGTITLSNPRRTDGGSPAPTLGVSSGVITVNDTPPPPDPGDGYDFASAIAAVPFAINLPAEPVITSEATVSTNAGITNSLAVSGRRTIVEPGNYSFGSLSIGGTDKELVLQPGVNITLTNNLGVFGASRVRVIGGNWNNTSGDYIIRTNNSSDVTIQDGVYFSPNGQGLIIAEGTSAAFQRFLLLSCSIESQFSTCILGGADGGTKTDIIMANSRLFNTTTVINGWALRVGVNNYSRVVFLDSLFHATQNTTIRQEGSCTDVYYARNQVNSSAWGWRASPGFPQTNVWFIDNLFHANAGSTNTLLNRPELVTNLVATGNQGVANQSVWWFSNTQLNPLTVVSPVPAPPAWEMQ